METIETYGDEGDALEEIEGSAQYDPFDTVLIAFTERLPHCFLFWGLPRDGDACATASRARRVLLNLAELDSFRWNEMPCIGEIKHAPMCGIRVRL